MVSTGNVFIILPLLVCKRNRVSVYAAAGLEVTAPDVVGREGAAGCGGGAWPARAAFSFSALRRRSSLSAAILARIRAFASISSCFSFRFWAASFSRSFFSNSSLISCDSLVCFRRISYFILIRLSDSGFWPSAFRSLPHSSSYQPYPVLFVRHVLQLAFLAILPVDFASLPQLKGQAPL